MVHTDTVNSLNESINQSINQSMAGSVSYRIMEYAKERKELQAAAERRAGDVPFLLGEWGIKSDSKRQLVDGRWTSGSQT
jgi:hypothetical protein